jgi:hypothetical protein
MLFHVTWELYEAFVLPDVRSVRNEWTGPQMQRVMESGKVREAGLLSGKRGGSSWWTSTLRRSVTPVETAGEIFRQWAEEGR